MTPRTKSTGRGPGPGSRMADARAKLGWSQADLAGQMDTTKGRVGLWELGLRRLAIEDAARAAQVLGVDFAWLATGAGQPEPTPRFHSGLARACWDTVSAWVQEASPALQMDPFELTTQLYFKAAAEGLDRAPAHDPDLGTKLRKLARFGIQIQ